MTRLRDLLLKNGYRLTSAAHLTSLGIRWFAFMCTSAPRKRFSFRSPSITQFSMAGAMPACSPKLPTIICMHCGERLSSSPRCKPNFAISFCWSSRPSLPRNTADSGRSAWKVANSSGYPAGNRLPLDRSAELASAKSKFQTSFPMPSKVLPCLRQFPSRTFFWRHTCVLWPC